MRNLLYVGLGVLFFNPVNSQTLNDLNFLTLSALNGSARYKSMAGAFGALEVTYPPSLIIPQAHQFFYTMKLELQ